MASREEILAAALPLEGLPWHPSGSSEESGVNCIGLMVCIAERLDRQDLVAAFRPYVGLARPEGRKSLPAALKHHLDFVPPARAEPGDVLLVKIPGRSPGDPELTHVALLLEHGEILEALELAPASAGGRAHSGRVVRRRNPYRVHSAYRLRASDP